MQIEVINIDYELYKTGTKKYTNYICEAFQDNDININVEKQLLSNVIFSVGFIDGKPAGICRFCKFDNRKTVLCSRAIETIEKYRGIGLATYVLGEGVDFLKEKYNCSKIISYIEKNNIASKRCHEKIGYKQNEKITYRNNRFCFDDADIFVKNIK